MTCSRFTHRGQVYRQTIDITRTLVGNKIVDDSYVVGTSPVGDASTASTFYI